MHVMPTAHPEHVTRPLAVIGRCQATCNQQKARERQRGLGPQEVGRFQTRKDDAHGNSIGNIFCDLDNNFFTLQFKHSLYKC